MLVLAWNLAMRFICSKEILKLLKKIISHDRIFIFEQALKSNVSIWEQAARRFIFPLNWRPRATIGKLWVTVKSSSVKVWQKTWERVIFLMALIVSILFYETEIRLSLKCFENMLLDNLKNWTFPASCVLENMSAFSYQCLSPFLRATNWSTVAQIDVGPSFEPWTEDSRTCSNRFRSGKRLFEPVNKSCLWIQSWNGLFHQHTNIQIDFLNITIDFDNITPTLK